MELAWAGVRDPQSIGLAIGILGVERGLGVPGYTNRQGRFGFWAFRMESKRLYADQ